MTLVARVAGHACKALLVAILLAVSSSAWAVDLKPLRSADTSSPRATLQSFVEGVDAVYLGMAGVIKSYAASDRLYLSEAERQRLADTIHSASNAIRCLDSSAIPLALRNVVPIERALQLKEILDRIDLPPAESIPDRKAMVDGAAKRWRLPDTEIDIVLIEHGPRAGEYLVSAATVDRLPDFFERVKALPYKAGPARDLRDAYRALSSGEIESVHEGYLTSPFALGLIVPLRWMVSLPDWAKTRRTGFAAWQWLGLALGLLVSALFLLGVGRLERRLARRKQDDAAPRWHGLLTPVAIILVAAFLLPAVSDVLRIGGNPRIVLRYVLSIAFFLSAAWLSLLGGSILGETIVASQHMRRSSLDSQLIRLGARFVGMVIAIGFLIEGADELGFPAYSVVAGLGVGGLAVALAARDSLANLLGSVLIMFEKPFRIGHVIRIGASEGVVEDVGFRSTRIRTSDNSLISIPNNDVVNASVENLSLRVMRRQRFFVQVDYDTPREKLEELVAAIRQVLADHPTTDKDNLHVRVNGFGDSGLNVLVYFYLRVPDYVAEIAEREGILLKIMGLAKVVGVAFRLSDTQR